MVHYKSHIYSNRIQRENHIIFNKKGSSVIATVMICTKIQRENHLILQKKGWQCLSQIFIPNATLICFSIKYIICATGRKKMYLIGLQQYFLVNQCSDPFVDIQFDIEHRAIIIGPFSAPFIDIVEYGVISPQASSLDLKYSKICPF